MQVDGAYFLHKDHPVARPRPYLHAKLPRPSGAGALPTHDAEGRPLLRLQTLGAVSLLVGDLRLSASAGTLFSLILRVASAPGLQVNSDELRWQFWPDQEDVRQRANLRQALYKLRGYGVRISMEAGIVLLDATQLLPTFSVQRTSEHFARDVTLGHEPFGTFLPGFAVPWPGLQQWIDEQRELVHADVRRVVAEQLQHRRDRADWGGAEALARWLLQFDPLNDEATLTLAECTAMSGSRKEAIAMLDRYLAELGPGAGELRLSATVLRRRLAEPLTRGRRSFAPTERHFVGRGEELSALTLAMRRARWHDGSAVLLHGAPGIGKSRLAHELEKVAVVEGVRVVQAGCRESDVLRPLSVFLDLVPEMLQFPGALGCAPESLVALRRLVPQERGARAVESPASASGSADAGADVPVLAREPMPMAASLRRAIVDLLAAVSDEKPILLIVEDVHWIDEHSWDVLADLVDRVDAMRVFMLLTSREAHARLQRPQRSPLGLQVRAVPPLSAASCLQLSRAIGEDLSAPVSDELGAWFVRASEGIPLFLRALVNHWIETGEAGGVPPTLQGVIEQRLSQLSSDALRVLQTAALLGKWATVERVGRVLELRSVETLHCLEQLSRLGALDPKVSDLVVSHDLVARSATERLTPLLRAAFHRRTAAVLIGEAETSHDSEILVASLDHLHRAGDEQVLATVTMANLEYLGALDAPAAGLRALTRIDTRHVRQTDRPRLASATARLLLREGAYTHALSNPLKGLLLPSIDACPSESEIDISLSLVDSTYRADPLVDRAALMAFTMAVSDLAYVSRETRLRACDIGLIIASNECDAVSAKRLYDAAKILDSEILASEVCRRVAILYHTIFGDHAIALRIAEALVAASDDASPTSSAYHDALRAGFSLRLVSSGSLHLRALERAFGISTALCASTHRLNAAWLLAQSHLELGDLSEFRRWVQVAERLFEEASDPIVCNFAVALFCRAAIEDARQDEARRYLLEYSRNMPRIATLKASSYYLSLQIAVELLDPDWLPAEDLLASLLSRQSRIGAFGTCDFLTSVAIEALCRLGRGSEALVLARTYLDGQRREVCSIGARLARTLSELDVKATPTSPLTRTRGQ